MHRLKLRFGYRLRNSPELRARGSYRVMVEVRAKVTGRGRLRLGRRLRFRLGLRLKLRLRFGLRLNLRFTLRCGLSVAILSVAFRIAISGCDRTSCTIRDQGRGVESVSVRWGAGAISMHLESFKRLGS